MNELPYITTREMRELDRAMIEDYRIELIQTMESAGRNLAALARTRFLDGDPAGAHVLALCGAGNNGGGGLVAARRLHAWGARVQVITTRPTESWLGVPDHQADIAERLGIPLTHAGELTVLGEFDLVLDAILGIGLEGAPRDEAARLIEIANEIGAPVLSLDVPSGLDATSGGTPGDAVTATATLALAAPKVGLRTSSARPRVGELWVADLGVPPELWAGSGLAYDVGPVFAGEEILRLW